MPPTESPDRKCLLSKELADRQLEGKFRPRRATAFLNMAAEHFSHDMFSGAEYYWERLGFMKEFGS